MKKWLDRYESGGGLVSKNSLNRNVTCSNCGWSWKLSDGGLDPMTCHKCGGDIKMREGGELDEYQDRGEVNFKDQLYQGNRPIIDNTAAPIVLPGNLFYDKTRVVNGSSAGLNKYQLKEINQNLKNNASREKQKEIEDYKAAELFHNNNPVAKLLGTRSAPASTIKPTARELAYGAGARINEFYDVPGIGIANDFVNPLSVVSKGIISPWMQAPLQAQQSNSYLPYAGAALSTALTVPMVRPASMAAKTILNPENISRGILESKLLYNDIATGNSIIPKAWKSPAVNLDASTSQAMFDKVLNSKKFTDAEKAMIREYQFNSGLFTVPGLKQEQFNSLIKKVNVQFPKNVVATRRFFNSAEKDSDGLGVPDDYLNTVFESVEGDPSNIKSVSIQNRPSAFSVGIGHGKEAHYGTNRIVLSGRNLKKVEGNFVKNNYEPVSNEYYKNFPKEELPFVDNSPDHILHSYYGASRKTPEQIKKIAEELYDRKTKNSTWLNKSKIDVKDYVGKPKPGTDTVYTKEEADKIVMDYNQNVDLFGNLDNKEQSIQKIIDGFSNYGFANDVKPLDEREIIGSGFDMKVIGKVKNDLGGYDYIVKPKNIKPTKKQQGGAIITNSGELNKYQNRGEVRYNVPTSDNLQYQKPVVSNFIVDPLSGGYVHDPARAAALLNQSINPGTISKTKDRSIGKQIYNVATNPMTSAQQLINKQPVTGLGPKNPFDFAFDAFPAMMAARQLPQIPGNLQRGEYLQAGLNALTAFPIAPMAGKLSKVALREGVDLVHPVGRALQQIEKKGIANGLSPQEIKNLQMREVGITSAQREGYFPGVSEIVSEYITPYSYDNAKKRILDIPRRIIKGEKNSKSLADLDHNFIFDFETKNLVSKPRYDAWRMYSGLPQEYGTFRLAETSPINHPSYSAEQLDKLEKFSLNDERRLLRNLPNPMDNAHFSYQEKDDLIEAIPLLKEELNQIKDLKNKGIDYSNDFNNTNVMGGYNRRFFNDKMEYNDIWDLDLNGNKVEKYFGKPFLSHGQLDYSFQPAEDEINRLIKLGESYSKNITIKKPPRLNFSFKDNGNYNSLLTSALQKRKKLKQGGPIITNRGQWDYPGQTTIIPSNQITMQGVPYPVMGVDNTGHTKMMHPGMNYTFPGQYVTEYPMMKGGGQKFNMYNYMGKLDKHPLQSPNVAKPVYQYTPQNLVAPSFNNLSQSTYSTTTPTDVKKAEEDYKKGKAYVNKQNAKAIEFHKKWMTSPMYKEMLYNSDRVNAKTIEKNRWNNFNNFTSVYNPIQPYDDPYVGGSSNTNTGNIEFYPNGVQDNVSNAGIHEFSHSIDRPINFFKFLLINKQRNIPQKDSSKMQNYINYNKSSQNENFTSQKYKEDPEFYNYVAEPTETRARLNDIRQKASQNKLYDPFTQKVTPEILKKILNFKFEEDQAWDPLYQLQNVYSNDEIMDLLNSVSKNNTDNNLSIPYAAFGGQMMRSGGSKNPTKYVTEYPMARNGKEVKKSSNILSRKDISGDALTSTLKREAVAAFPYLQGIGKSIEKGISYITPDYKSQEDRELLFRRHRPVEYPSISSGLADVVRDYSSRIFNTEMQQPFRDKDGDYEASEEAWRMTLGLPVKSKYIIPSAYRPLNETNKASKYYTLNENIYNKDLLRKKVEELKLKPGQSALINSFAPFINENYMNKDEFSQVDPIQNFQIGVNKKGKMYFYDKYDFDFEPATKVVKPYEYEFYNEFKTGGEMIKRADGSYSKRGLWDNIRDNRGSGKAPTKQMLDQERKIRNQYKDGGEEDTYWRTKQPMVNDPSMDAISKVLLYRNQDKNFMQRAAGFGNQNSIPTRYIDGQDPDSKNNSSLLMSSNDNFEENFHGVYPEIIQTAPSQLSYQPRQNKEYIETPTWDIADYFATKGYKRAANDMYGMNYQTGGQIPTIDGPSGYMNEDNVWIVDNETIKRQAKELGAKRVLTEGGSLVIFDNNWNIVGVDDNPNASYRQGGSVILNTGGEQHRIYVKSTNRGEGDKGHIMVNHPTMNKGMWDTIDLTQKAGATTIAQGVAATKEWHRENPYMKQRGGEQNNNLKNINLNLPVIRHQEMNPLHFNGFLANDKNQNLFIGGVNPRYQNEDFSVGPYMIGVGNKYFQKFPADMGMSGTYHVNDNFDINMGVGQNNVNAGIKYNFANGGYVVRRSHDRKGKTHVVTGPDGTKKYFGDPNMGERGNSKYGKEAFYARHKSNLAKNPYFRAYARATWEEGGEIMAIGGQTMMNPITRKDNRNWLEFLKN